MKGNRAEDGFSIIEASMGLAIAAIAAVMFVGAMASTHRLSATNRQHQQATEVAVAELESARSLSWTALANSSFNSSAPLLVGTTPVLSATETGIPTDEALKIVTGAGVAPLQNKVVDGSTYTVWSYVTTSGYATDVRRVVVQVAWSVAASNHQVVFSTLISQAGAP